MKIFVLSAKRGIIYLLILVAVVTALFIASYSKFNVVNVFSSNKDLPIYYVDCKEKKAAITFDCAWGAEL